jgi:hypothetical protein
MKTKTSERRCSEVVARYERLKTKFATYLGLAKQRINIMQLAGQTDESSRLVCCLSCGIRRAEYCKPKNMNPNQQQDSTAMNTNSTKQLKMKIVALKAIGQRSVYNFFGFFGGAWLKDKNWLEGKGNLIPHDERLVLDLLRGKGKLIAGDLNVDEEGFVQNDRNLAITTPWLHWLPSHAHMSWPHKKAKFLHMQLGTQARIEKIATKLADEWLTQKLGSYKL